jgi:hypothetical protein
MTLSAPYRIVWISKLTFLEGSFHPSEDVFG